ncbi:MAG: hypothetical protein C0475_08355 [Planctomyces sp.]|nr:hypothetical protein [Planctomyces sp.]MBA4040106.1 hypothetical protein [Planctomyces sp.]
MEDGQARVLLVAVGNTRTRVGRYVPLGQGGVGGPSGAGRRGELEPSRVMVNADRSGLLEALSGEARSLATADSAQEPWPAGVPRVVLAGVHRGVLREVHDALAGAAGRVAVLVAPPPVGGAGNGRSVSVGGVGGVGGGGVPIPIAHELPEPVTVGTDRLLNALGAWGRSGEACVIIDAGTAVTVDLVDSGGVFRGGVIAPGVGAMLGALHASAQALPLVEPPMQRGEALPVGPLGTTTVEAMLLGCAQAVRGLLQRCLEAYAAQLGSYPRVIATGGDAPALFEHDDLVEHVVPDLGLMGMAAAWESLYGAGGALPGAVARADGDDPDDDEIDT